MTITGDSVSEREERPKLPAKTWPRWAFGSANVAIALAAAIVLWWLLIDPKWSALGLYPQPFTALLFWVILGTVWVGFTFGWTGPASFPQPLRGLVAIALSAVIGVALTILLAYGWGAIDPSFAANREGGAGFATGSLFVLFGFYFYVCAAINADHWPWSGRTSRPLAGLGALTAVLVPTAVLFAVLALPGLAVWAKQGTALMSTPTLIGWFYSIVTSAVLTGLIAENLPWSLARRPGVTAILAVLGNVLLGTAIYFILLLPVSKLLMGAGNVEALGSTVTMHAAELGVCWVLWMIAWANVFGNEPTRLSRVANIAIRMVVTFVLGAATYMLYFFVLAPFVLHEPKTAATLYGDALGFIDWVILVLIWYFLFLDSHGLRRPRVRTADA